MEGNLEYVCIYIYMLEILSAFGNGTGMQFVTRNCCGCEVLDPN